LCYKKPIVFIEVPLYNALLMLQKSHEIRQKKPLYFFATYVIILYVVLVNLHLTQNVVIREKFPKFQF